MFKNYVKRFFTDEEGAELLEWAVILGVCAAMIIIISVIVAVVKNKAIDAGKAIDEADGSGGSVDWDAQRVDVDAAFGNGGGNGGGN